MEGTYVLTLHAQVSAGPGAAASGQIGDQDDHNQQDQGTTDGNRDDVRRIDGIAVLGDRELGVVFVVERLELQLGHGDGRVESGGINRGQVQLLGAVAVVGHVHRGLEQGLGIDQPDGLVVLSVGELIAVDNQGKVQSGEGKLVLGGVQLERDHE